jgi:glycosyltransferase involved in cell wall biosynthesis
MDAWDSWGRLRGLQLYNLAWQASLARVVTRLHRRAPFDVGHHVTLSTDWVPSGLAFVPDLPLVWGPLGGSERVPAACRPYLGWRGRLTEALRILGTTPVRALLAGPAARRSTLLVAQNADEARSLERYGRPVQVRPNVFLDSSFPSPEGEPAAASGRPRRAVFVGRLLAWKGVHLALATMAQEGARDWVLDVYGEGPERGRLARAVSAAGLQDRVRLLGRRPRDEVRTALALADALLFPSTREAAGWVVAEAMAVGCPVVCLDVAGPPLIAGTSGVAVPPGPALPASLALALDKATDLPRRVVRWDESELPELLTRWYESAASTPRRPSTARA